MLEKLFKRLSKGKSSIGFSLLEAIVAVLIIGMISVLLIQGFVYGKDYYVKHQARIEMQQEAMKSLKMLASGLSQSSTLSVTIIDPAINPELQAVSFVVQEGIDPDKHPKWEPFFTIYCLSQKDNILIKKHYPPRLLLTDIPFLI